MSLCDWLYLFVVILLLWAFRSRPVQEDYPEIVVAIKKDLDQ